MQITNAIKIKSILETRIVTLSIILFTTVGRIIQVIFLFNIRSDRSYQMLATRNFLSGHGISLAHVLPGNLSKEIYEPLIKWPPGYSLLLSPVYFICNNNYIIAGLALEIFFSILLIFITRSILKTLHVQPYLVNIYTLFTGFIIYPFYIKPSSDAIAITFFLLAFHFTLSLLSRNKHTNLKIAGLIISLLLSGSIKYLFIPVVFIIPLFLLVKGIIDANPHIKRIGIFSLFILGTTLSALLLYQKNVSGSAIYITQPMRGFFPENLISPYPFIPASFINPETAGMILQKKYTEGSLVDRIFQVIHLFTFFIIFLYGLWLVYKNRFKKLSATSTFFYLSFFVSLSITLLLMMLSVRVAKEDGWWTYVQEPRYYGLIILLIQLSFFIIYQYDSGRFKKYTRYIFIIFLVLMLPDMFRGITFSAKRIVHYKKEEYSWQTELKIQQYADSIIKKEKIKYSVAHAVLTGSSDYMNNRVCLYSHIPQMDSLDKINNLSSLNTKTPILLLVMLRQDVLPAFQAFLNQTEKEVAGNFYGFYFYTVYVKPH